MEKVKRSCPCPFFFYGSRLECPDWPARRTMRTATPEPTERPPSREFLVIAVTYGLVAFARMRTPPSVTTLCAVTFGAPRGKSRGIS